MFGKKSKLLMLVILLVSFLNKSVFRFNIISGVGFVLPRNIFGHADPAIPILLDDLSCRGNESSVNECQHRFHVDGCRHADDVSIGCAFGSIDAVRLVGGSNSTQNKLGRVEVQSQGLWGAVCNDMFDNNAASVVCHSLGYLNDTGSVVRPLRPIQHEALMLLDDVTCVGDESSVNECQHSPIGEHNCDHADSVSIACGYAPDGIVSEVRLVNDRTRNPQEGRLEVHVNGTWGTVCDDFFGGREARVVCRMLGYPVLGAQPMDEAQFGEGSGPILLDQVDCLGSEHHLEYCQFSTSHNCYHTEDVGVRCGTFARTVTHVRLVNGSNPQEGRLEVRVNGTWGTVCDDIFSNEEARVVCRMLGFPTEGAVSFDMAPFGQGAGPIQLDNVNCVGYENHLDSCRFARSHNCHHAEDVGVRCGYHNTYVTFHSVMPISGI